MKGTHHFEKNKVIISEKKIYNSDLFVINNSDDDIYSGIMPSKDTSFKIQSKLCSKHSFDCENNENTWLGQDWGQP